MLHLKRILITLILVSILIVAFVMPAYAEDKGIIIIILEPAAGWSKILKIDGKVENLLSGINSAAHDDIKKIDGISVN